MGKNIRLLFIVMCTFFIFIGTNCYAALWWGTPGYEWALNRNLTTIKTQAQLSRDVTVNDYYDTILKYLNMKNIEPKNRVIQNLYTTDIYNGVIKGLVKDINSYISTSVTTLTPNQYRDVESLVNHAKESFPQYSDLLTRDDLKALNLYLDLAKYRAASLLTENTKIERQYKNNVLYSLRNTKYASSLNYGIMPMFGQITRGAFLSLMYNLLSNNTLSYESIIKSFNDSGVLLGYNDSLWLNQNLKYSEMLTFLHRFEFYDFDTSTNAELE